LRNLLLVLLVVVCACAQVVPSHDIPAKPEYIRAGVKPGDSVQITTRDGEVHRIVVEEVTADAIRGPETKVRFSDIEKLVKRSWSIPEHPCGGNKPLGCSIPEVVLVLSDEYGQQAEKFHPACITHDFCYRHGFATYGETRAQCDDNFYADMRDACKGWSGLGRLDVSDYAICEAAARQTYDAVQRYGAKNYRDKSSSYCEYR